MAYIYADANDGEPIFVVNVRELTRDGNKRYVFHLENGKTVKVAASRMISEPKPYTPSTSVYPR